MPSPSPSPTDRRKSIFNRAPRAPSPLSPITTDYSGFVNRLRKKKSSSSLANYFVDDDQPITALPSTRPGSSAAHSSYSFGPDSPRSSSATSSRPASKKSKSHRASSMFGLRRGEDENGLGISSPGGSWVDSPGRDFMSIGKNRTILQHGDAQTSSGWLRKKREYLILTETHLVRYKSQAKAAENFPLLGATTRSPVPRHVSSSSVESAISETLSGASNDSQDMAHAIPLEQIVAVFLPDQNRNPASLELATLDNESGQCSFMTLGFYETVERDSWLEALRRAANTARLEDPDPIAAKHVHWAVGILERDHDYDPASFRMYKVVKRSTARTSRGGLENDIEKSASGPSVRFLVIGLNKVHLISVPITVGPSSNLSLKDSSLPTDPNTSHGIVILNGIQVIDSSDDFLLAFRLPFQKTENYQLSSLAGPDFALELRKRDNVLRPLWPFLTYPFNVPFDDYTQNEVIEADFAGFWQTLSAFFSAYGLDASRVSCEFVDVAEDPSQFVLYPPPFGDPYTALELMAILRAIRWNERIGTIVFTMVNLDPLNGIFDPHGSDFHSQMTRSGIHMGFAEHQQLTPCLLVSELRALATSNRRLRRFLAPGAVTPNDLALTPSEQPESSAIFEAFDSICRNQTTNVDWFCVNHIRLSDLDLGYLVNICVDRKCHLRGLEVSGCGLTSRSINLIMDALKEQSNTLEIIDVSHNTAPLEPFLLSRQLDSLAFIRRLDLSYRGISSTTDPVLGFDTLKQWRLESLILDGITLNEHSLRDLGAYLAHPRSEVLKTLSLNGCGLTGLQAAGLMVAMTVKAPRSLALKICENRLTIGHKSLVNAIKKDQAPSDLFMQPLEYYSNDEFAQLLHAIAENKSIHVLDISRVSIPAQAEESTSKAFEHLFAKNNTLRWLDVSGELSRLEAIRLGHGLVQALPAIKDNKALRTLVIKYQQLGLEGVEMLGEVIRSNNTLEELICDYNDVNLSGFTTLVNAMEHNRKLTYLPSFEESRNDQLVRTQQEIQAARSDMKPSTTHNKMTSVRRTFAKISTNTAGNSEIPSSPKKKPPASVAMWTHQDQLAAMKIVSDRWEAQNMRLRKFLERNARINDGVAEDDDLVAPVGPVVARLSTSGSINLTSLMEKVTLDRTPRAEKQVELSDPASLHATNGTRERTDSSASVASSKKRAARTPSMDFVASLPARLGPLSVDIDTTPVFEKDDPFTGMGAHDSPGGGSLHGLGQIRMNKMLGSAKGMSLAIPEGRKRDGS